MVTRRKTRKKRKDRESIRAGTFRDNLFPGEPGWIKLFAKGDTHFDRDKIVNAAEDMSSCLMSKRLTNTLKIRLEYRKDLKDKDATVAGFQLCQSKGSCFPKRHYVKLKKTKDTRDFLNTLAHEMIHVQQRATGRLQKRLWSSDKKVHCRWEGKEVGVCTDIPYTERPWEIEAYKTADDIVSCYKHKCWKTRGIRKCI